MSEALAEIPTDRLPLEQRNELQRIVMVKMIGEQATDIDQLQWALNYAKKVSDIIDHHEHDEIRTLAANGDYDQAAEVLISVLKT